MELMENSVPAHFSALRGTDPDLRAGQGVRARGDKGAKKGTGGEGTRMSVDAAYLHLMTEQSADAVQNEGTSSPMTGHKFGPYSKQHRDGITTTRSNKLTVKDKARNP